MVLMLRPTTSTTTSTTDYYDLILYIMSCVFMTRCLTMVDLQVFVQAFLLLRESHNNGGLIGCLGNLSSLLL